MLSSLSSGLYRSFFLSMYGKSNYMKLNRIRSVQSLFWSMYTEGQNCSQPYLKIETCYNQNLTQRTWQTVIKISWLLWLPGDVIMKFKNWKNRHIFESAITFELLIESSSTLSSRFFISQNIVHSCWIWDLSTLGKGTAPWGILFFSRR